MKRTILFISAVVFIQILSLNLSAEAKKGKKEKKEIKEQSQGEKKDEVDDLLNQAVILYNEGKFLEAVEVFKNVSQLSKDPSIIYNIARCYDKAYRYKEAHDYYEEYLLTGDKVKANDAIEAMKRIEEMMLILKVISKPEGARVEIDGKEVENQKTPVIVETKAGKHKVVVKMDGYKDAEGEVEIPYGGEGRFEVELESALPPEPEIKAEEALTEKKTSKPEVVAEKKVVKIPVTLGVSAGATVSTNNIIGSFVDASIFAMWRIKGGLAGIGLDNLIFGDSYSLVAYVGGGYRLKVWKMISLDFVAGFGGVYFNSFDDGGDGKGNILVPAGNHWDLAGHGEVRVCIDAGPVFVVVTPVHANIFIGVGNLDPSPLAEFAFLAGVGYNFGK